MVGEMSVNVKNLETVIEE